MDVGRFVPSDTASKMSYEEMERLAAEESHEWKYDPDEDEQPMTLERIRAHIDYLMFNEEDWDRAVTIGMTWAQFCCPGVFSYDVREYRQEDDEFTELGVFFRFDRHQPTAEQMEGIALMRGYDNMLYTGMTDEWKELVALHVARLVDVAFRDSYFVAAVNFFEEDDDDWPKKVLVESALH
ncbi:hypothetical protein NPX13_g4390 [Xylaria arbuscula]|uniref:Uncharacterized protein n=1 Tax=Xylaria arbuscula TaxID=114810 RepID=A0A9W8NGK9_9PEZI|nr:hypothetical protein NPX13_g4390 [Xylaria arbuscula]